MKVCIIIYDKMAFHSVALLAYLLKEEGVLVRYIADQYGMITTKEGLMISGDEVISEIKTEEYDGIIVPGGEPSLLLRQNELKTKINEFLQKQKIVGSICAGTIVLAEFGLLAGKKYTSSFDFSSISTYKDGTNIKKAVVHDENLITARGQALIEFALVYLNALGAIKPKEMTRLYKRYKPEKYKITWKLKIYDRDNT